MRYSTGARALGIIAAGLLALAGCVGGGGDAKNSGPTQGEVRTLPPASSSPKLSKEWRPKLDDLPATAATQACQDVSSPSCGELLRRIHEGLAEMRTDLEAAGGRAAYPKTSEQLAKMDRAYETYDKKLCGEPSVANADGSPCYKAALDITVGVPQLGMTLTTDEARG